MEIPFQCQRLFLNPLHLLLCLLLMSFTRVVRSFSTDGVYHLESVVRHLHGDSTSHFGYSVASYIGQGQPFCLVGAPNATDEYDDTVRLGGLYRVAVSLKGGECGLVPIGTDDFIRKMHGQRVPAESVSLGASVASATDGPNGVQLGCDPRHIFLSPDLNGTASPLGIGQCGLYTGHSMDYTVIDPCSGREEGACLAGFSSSVTPGPKPGLTSVAVGMPGSFLVEGNIFLGTYQGTKMLNKVVLKASPTDLKNLGYNLGYSIVMTKLLPTKEDGKPSAEHIITASPIWKTNEHRGVVIITDREMNLDQLIFLNDTEGHLGSFFGYSLAAGDFNGDGIGDIVVSAPYFSNFTTFAANLGRVYIFYGGSVTTANGVTNYVANSDGNPAVLSGTDAGGRFGHALTVLGDIDHDGVDDLAVGCPFCGGEGGIGAVYIFLGIRGGKMSAEPLQIIRASDVPLKPVLPTCPAGLEDISPEIRPFRSFGWSLAGRYDTDNNEVPDLIVGDYQSSQIAVLRGRVFVSLTEPTWTIDSKKTIRWTGRGNQDCGSDCRFNISLKVDVSGLESFLSQETVVFTVLIDLDSAVKDLTKKRLAIVSKTPTSLPPTSATSTKEVLSAFRMPTYVTSSTASRRSFLLYEAVVEPLYINTKANVWLPVVFNITVVPRVDEGFTPLGKLPWQLHPVQSERVFLSRDLRFNNTACGADNVCIADLFVQVYDTSTSTSTPDIVYFHERISRRNLTLYIGNKGENAYKARLLIRFPQSLEMDLPRNLQCEPEENSIAIPKMEQEVKGGVTMRSLLCALGDPVGTTHNLPAKYAIQLVTGGAFQGILKGTTSDKLQVSFQVISGNQDSEPFDNEATLIYTLKATANVEISSSSMDRTIIDPRNFSVPIAPFQKIHTTTLGPKVKHIFLVSNSGPSPAETVWVNVSIPVLTADGDHLVYLLDNVRHLVGNGEPVTISMAPRVVSVDGNVRGECYLPAGSLDPLNLNAVDIRSSSPSRRPRRQIEQPVSPQVSLPAAKYIEELNLTSSMVNRPARSLIPTLRVSQQEVIQCGSKSRVFGKPRCVVVQCKVNYLTRNDAVRVVIEGWLWAETFFRYKVSDAIVHTSASGQIAKTTYRIPVTGDRGLVPLSISQNFVFDGIKILVIKQIPIWPIVLGALLGLLALTLIIVAMWRCGFFKRNRIFKSDSPSYM